jgi:hypothetical protein
VARYRGAAVKQNAPRAAHGTRCGHRDGRRRSRQFLYLGGAREEPRDPKYVLARDAIEKTFRERLTLLEPATRAKIEASLSVIQKAHEDIRKALAADPQSPVLEQLWESTWHDEFDLYDRVVEATQPTMTRT